MVFCKHCGKEVMDADTKFCPKCGKPPADQPTTPTVAVGYNPYKNPGTAALIAIIGGIFGFPGIGHIYVGRIARGILILISGIILFVLGLIAIFAGAALGPAGFAAGAVFGFIFIIIYVVIWIWQIFDARSLAKQFNEQVKATGKEPW